MLLLAVEKTIGAVFFLVATIVLFVLQARGVTHPLQQLFAGELQEDPHDLAANLLIGLFPEVSRSALMTLTLVSAPRLLAASSNSLVSLSVMPFSARPRL